MHSESDQIIYTLFYKEE